MTVVAPLAADMAEFLEHARLRRPEAMPWRAPDSRSGLDFSALDEGKPGSE